MKYIKRRFIAAGLCASMALTVGAQEVAVNQTDSLTASTKKVNVAFGQVAADDLLGGISVVDVESLMEKNYFTYANSDMAAYVGGFNGKGLWGQDTDNQPDNQGYLVLVDGFPREENNVLPTEITSITFLKGAQAVILYGSRAAKGALLITTKRGYVDGLETSVRVNTGFHVMKSVPEYLGSAEYMSLYRLNALAEAQPEVYSTDDINLFAQASNPYRYPSINYYSDEYIKQYYNRTDATIEFNGGGERAHFYSNVSYYRQGDYLNYGVSKDDFISRLNIRGNVDMIITDFITATVDANATFYDSQEPNANHWDAAKNNRPNVPANASPLIPIDQIDPAAVDAIAMAQSSNCGVEGMFYGGSTGVETNAIADMYSAGSGKFVSRGLDFGTSVRADLRALLEGLSFEARFGFDYGNDYRQKYENKYAIYIPTWSSYNGNDVIVSLEKKNDDEKSGNQNISDGTNKRTASLQAQFSYKNTFAGVHNVDALFGMYAFQGTRSGQYHRTANANLSWQIAYNLGKKYYATYRGNVIHSAKLPDDNRNHMSYSGEIGWNLTKESFLEGNSIINNLVVSAAYSNIKQDIDLKIGDNEYFLYNSNWGRDYGFDWYDGASDQYTTAKRGDNPELAPLERKEFSANLKAAFLNNLITLDASYYTSTTSGYPIDNASYFPSYFKVSYPGNSSFIPIVNYNENKRWGYDFAVNVQKQINDFGFQVGINGAYFDTEASIREELNADNEQYRNRQGTQLDAIWGLKSNGIIQTQEQLDKAVKSGYGHAIGLGDLEYVNQNYKRDENGNIVPSSDDVVNDDDQVVIGRGDKYGAPFSLGLNLTLKYKGFTFFAAATGSFGSYALKNDAYYWINKGGKYSAAARDSWNTGMTDEQKLAALYPRISEYTGHGHNHVASDFWMYKNNRLDLKKVQLTYDLPETLFENIFLNGVQAYVNGSDLFVFAKEREHMERSVGAAPQSRFFNLGVKVKF